ncbi:MAG: TraR/DksA family transcriptional regulator [Deltaproteobacteria bacterium]|nr:TraR/DksA family transcriptional regulator [Deltaproteobacteria bacterium]
MNKKLLEKFKKLLQKEREGVLYHLNELKGSSEQQLEQGPGDEVDIASSEITQTSLQKLGSREQKHLSKIDYALQKIESGEYGTCEMCGEDIAPARLEARPIALYCIDCKTQQEQRERQYIDEDERDEDGWESIDGDEAGE